MGTGVYNILNIAPTRCLKERSPEAQYGYRHLGVYNSNGAHLLHGVSKITQKRSAEPQYEYVAGVH